MASILVYIELLDNKATVASLCALNAGRTIASGLGATLCALVPCVEPPSYENDDIITILSKHGADKVILTTHSALGTPGLFATHGEALLAASQRIHPRLVLFANSAAGQDLAPRLAANISASFRAAVRIDQDDTGFQIVSDAFRRRYRIKEPLHQIDQATVLTLSLADAVPRQQGDDEAEVVVIQIQAPEDTGLRIQRRSELPLTEPAVSKIAVGGGAGLAAAEAFELVHQLARALKGVPVATRTACASGLAEPALQVGMGGFGLNASLYFALGISGSEDHLAGVSPNTTVVAINTDPDAPILRSAQYCVIADAPSTIRAMLELLSKGDAQ